ncbi:hypothetical protein CN327_08350 [Bacillus cereus]|uniref:hypothetical protein n=1 Tax=Bacillus nitratireducens TaxID=2026193 RepID=UPI000BED6971|nr:hypothetical protein CON44_08640 [Bacillus cereus]PEX97964.1 hypothetical protein CN465_01435 [Bacillus cereus]PFF35423.1 hypothetical protein CN327_08350 [Bacillus cereus]PFJ78206.1 hypothetical protein COI95_17245 [Bacillus cereus]PFK10515.1 hypothetical protein COJ05_28950 [Bacillus cereus]
MNMFYSSYVNTARTQREFTLNYSAIFCIALFVLNETTRKMIDPAISAVNILFFVFGGIYVFKSVLNKRMSPTIFFIVVMFSLLVILNLTLVWSYPTRYTLFTFCNLLIPLLLVGIKIKYEQALEALKVFLRIFNFFIILLFLSGIIDVLTKSGIQLALAATVFKGKELDLLIIKENLSGIYRFYSFAGHPLTNAKYFLIFYIMNKVYAKKVGYLMNRYLITLITMVGLVLCGSKTALVLFVILLIFYSDVKKHKFLYYIGIASLLLVIYNSDLFEDNLKQRFVEGFTSGNISSGRNDLLELLVNSSSAELPGFFYGGGANSSREMALELGGGASNFEYPLIMLAYDYGILGTLIIYICIFFYPIYVFWRNKDFYIMVNFIFLTLMINSNNSIANLSSDYMAQHCFLILLLINISRKNYMADH